MSANLLDLPYGLEEMLLQSQAWPRPSPPQNQLVVQRGSRHRSEYYSLNQNKISQIYR